MRLLPDVPHLKGWGLEGMGIRERSRLLNPFSTRHRGEIHTAGAASGNSRHTGPTYLSSGAPLRGDGKLTALLPLDWIQEKSIG